MLDVARSHGVTIGRGGPLVEERPRRSGRPSVLVVANENASGIKGHREAVDHTASLIRSLGASVETTWTASPEELETILAPEERRVVLLGGDGTLHAVANVNGHRPEVALLPFGRANNVAWSLGIPFDVRAAATLAITGRSLALDGIAVETPGLSMVAVEGISAGFHAHARARYRGVNSADTKAGIAAAVGAFARFRPIRIALDVEGDAEVRRLAQLFVANFPLFGPRLPVAPSADPTDGLLDVVELEAAGRLSLAAQFARLKRSRHLDAAGVRIRTARRLRVVTCNRSPVVADTTVINSGSVELSVRRHALRVVTPAS